jgi:hypothetical protein
MKFTITYEYDITYGAERPYWAKAKAEWGELFRCGESWEEARKRLVCDLQKLGRSPTPIPPDEEVEI